MGSWLLSGGFQTCFSNKRVCLKSLPSAAQFTWLMGWMFQNPSWHGGCFHPAASFSSRRRCLAEYPSVRPSTLPPPVHPSAPPTHPGSHSEDVAVGASPSLPWGSTFRRQKGQILWRNPKIAGLECQSNFYKSQNSYPRPDLCNAHTKIDTHNIYRYVYKCTCVYRQLNRLHSGKISVYLLLIRSLIIISMFCPTVFLGCWLKHICHQPLLNKLLMGGGEITN